MGIGIATVAFFAALIALPKLANQHLNRINRLRYKDGDVSRALFEFNLWRPFIPRTAYLTLRMGMLAQAELYESAEALLQDPALGPSERWNTKFAIYSNQEKWSEADDSLSHAVNETTSVQRTAFLIQRAGFIAEKFPARIPEALQIYRRALETPIIAGIEELFLSYEGRLLTFAGQGPTGLSILNLHTSVLEKKAIESYSMLPHLAEHRRHLGFALWATGSREKAQEMLLQSLSTYRSPKWTKVLERDLARIRDGESLFEEPTQDGLEAGRLYVKSYQLRTHWPGLLIEDDELMNSQKTKETQS